MKCQLNYINMRKHKVRVRKDNISGKYMVEGKICRRIGKLDYTVVEEGLTKIEADKLCNHLKTHQHESVHLVDYSKRD